MNQAVSHGDSANTSPVAMGISALNQRVFRRPSLAVMVEAKGVKRKMPAYPVAANNPAVAVSNPASFKRSKLSGNSMKTPTSSRKVDAKSAESATCGDCFGGSMARSVGGQTPITLQSGHPRSAAARGRNDP